MSNGIGASRDLRIRIALWLVAGSLAAALVALAVFKTWAMLHPAVTARARLNPACDLRVGPCSVRLPTGGEIGLDIQPRGIPVVQPLQVAVDLKGIAASRVEVDFAGVDMNMGYNRIKLAEVRPGHYGGKAMLPVCVRGRMLCEAKVLVRAGGRYLLGPFRFETSRR